MLDALLEKYRDEGVLNLDDANVLKVTRPTIYRWMDDRSLGYVRDDMSGRTLVVRRDVEGMKVGIDAEAEETGDKHVSAIHDP